MCPKGGKKQTANKTSNVSRSRFCDRSPKLTLRLKAHILLPDHVYFGDQETDLSTVHFDEANFLPFDNEELFYDGF